MTMMVSFCFCGFLFICLKKNLFYPWWWLGLSWGSTGQYEEYFNHSASCWFLIDDSCAIIILKTSLIRVSFFKWKKKNFNIAQKTMQMENWLVPFFPRHSQKLKLIIFPNKTRNAKINDYVTSIYLIITYNSCNNFLIVKLSKF
jgi:hypothetical protein